VKAVILNTDLTKVEQLRTVH